MVLNQGPGIRAAETAHITGNVVTLNEGSGIDAGVGSTLHRNTVVDNAGDGIRANSSSTVHANTLRDNGGWGLFFQGSQSNYRGNTISINQAGAVGFGPNHSAINTGGNTCNVSLCP